MEFAVNVFTVLKKFNNISNLSTLNCKKSHIKRRFFHLPVLSIIIVIRREIFNNNKMILVATGIWQESRESKN